MPEFLRSKNPEVLIASARLLAELNITDLRSEQTQILPLIRMQKYARLN